MGLSSSRRIGGERLGGVSGDGMGLGVEVV